MLDSLLPSVSLQTAYQVRRSVLPFLFSERGRGIGTSPSAKCWTRPRPLDPSTRLCHFDVVSRRQVFGTAQYCRSDGLRNGSNRLGPSAMVFPASRRHAWLSTRRRSWKVVGDTGIASSVVHGYPWTLESRDWTGSLYYVRRGAGKTIRY